MRRASKIGPWSVFIVWSKKERMLRKAIETHELQALLTFFKVVAESDQ